VFVVRYDDNTKDRGVISAPLSFFISLYRSS